MFSVTFLSLFPNKLPVSVCEVVSIATVYFLRFSSLKQPSIDIFSDSWVLQCCRLDKFMLIFYLLIARIKATVKGSMKYLLLGKNGVESVVVTSVGGNPLMLC